MGRLYENSGKNLDKMEGCNKEQRKLYQTCQFLKGETHKKKIKSFNKVNILMK